jgi:hypothetical protein
MKKLVKKDTKKAKPKEATNFSAAQILTCLNIGVWSATLCGFSLISMWLYFVSAGSISAVAIAVLWISGAFQ